MRNQRVRVTVPASTANLGPGFDALGMAFQLYATIEMQVAEKTEVQLAGAELGALSADKSNLLYQVAAQLFEQAGLAAPELSIKAKSDIPLTRGLGSSAAAIVGALVAANSLAGDPFSREELFAMASRLEGHPDNVGAAMFGGIVVSAMPEDPHQPVPYVRFSPPAGLRVMVVIPDFWLSTEKARQVLPEVYSKRDVIYNVGHSSLLVAALAYGRLDLLAQAMRDRLHQPYRAELVPGLTDILEGAPRHGALGAALSGAGPTILCFYSGEEEKQQLSSFVEQVMARNGIAYRTMLLKPDQLGVQVEFPE
jgi:homoserine kinase